MRISKEEREIRYQTSRKSLLKKIDSWKNTGKLKPLYRHYLEIIKNYFKHYVIGEDVVFTDRRYFPVKILYYID